MKALTPLTASVGISSSLYLGVEARIGVVSGSQGSFTGPISASVYYGDGSQLINLPGDALTTIQISGAITGALIPYATLDGVTASFTTPTQVSSAISNFPTRTETSGAITASLTAYPTRIEVSGVLTSSVALLNRVNTFTTNQIISGNLNISGVLSSSGIYASYFDLNTGSLADWRNGRVAWDETEAALVVYNFDSGALLHVGQEQWVRARNQTGSPISRGTAVRVSGSIGDRPSLKLARAVDTNIEQIQETDLLGLTIDPIAHGEDGFVITQGILGRLDTSQYLLGARVWVSTTPGLITTTLPVAPIEKIIVGVVTRINANNGSIFVNPVDSLDFRYLSSVSSSTTTIGDIWTYIATGSTGVWINTQQLSGTYGITGSIRVTNNISASYITGTFSGDGANLANLPLSAYATLAGVSASFVTPVQTSGAISSFPTRTEVTGVLNNYATLSGVSASFVTPLQISSSITSAVVDFATRTEISGAITSSLSGYATLSGVSASFATHSQVSGAITSSLVDIPNRVEVTGVLNSYSTLSGVSSSFATPMQVSGAITASLSDITRKLINFINEGPAETYTASYLEIGPSGSALATASIWYADAAKTIKIYEESYTRPSGSVNPNIISYKLYNVDGSTILIQATDTVSYGSYGPISITRSVSSSI